MRISKYLHSCIVVEDSSTRILIDPGAYSFVEKRLAPEDFTNISAVLITHNHQDHADPVALKIILANNSSAKVYGNADTQTLLGKENILVELFESGVREFGSLSVEAIPSAHEVIPFSLPENTAYVFNKKFLVTGDSLNAVLHQFSGIELLALPTVAPWTKLLEVSTFAQTMKPKIAVPVHDIFFKDFFRERQYAMLQGSFAASGIDFRPLSAPGEFVEI